MEKTKIEIRKNGPMAVHGEMEITMIDGTIEKRERITTFCRCGASENKPFCDGAHKRIGFEG